MNEELKKFLVELSTWDRITPIYFPGMPELSSESYSTAIEHMEIEDKLFNYYLLDDYARYFYIVGKLRVIYNIPVADVMWLESLITTNIARKTQSHVKSTIDEFTDIYQSGIYDFQEILTVYQSRR